MARPKNALEHAVGMLKNVVVPEPKNGPSKTIQVSGALAIGLLAVLPAISFDNQSTLRTGEVCYETPDGFLSAELESFELAISQVRPEPTLRVGELATQSARVRVYVSNGRHTYGLEEEKPSPNPLPHAGEG
jgi:hypothetical protein